MSGRGALPQLGPDLPDASPYQTEGGEPACLLLHGFTGTPFELRPVGEALAREGYAVRAPLLPGHGTGVADLMNRRRQEWFEATESAASALATSHGPVVVVGLSLGALLALRLAALSPPFVRGIVALAPALRLRPWSEWPLARLSRLQTLPPIRIPKLGGSDIRDRAMRRRNPAYGAQPLRSAVELHRVAREVEGLLSRITAPVLCIHGARDRTVPPRAMDLVLRGVASAERTRVLLPRSGHVLPLDVEREQVVLEILRFLRRLAAPATAR